MRSLVSCVCVWRATQHPEHEFSSNATRARRPIGRRLRSLPSTSLSGERRECCMKRGLKRPLLPRAATRQAANTRQDMRRPT